MYSSYASQSGALIDDVCLLDASHRDGEDTCVDGEWGVMAQSAMTAVTAVQQISVVAFPWQRDVHYSMHVFLLFFQLWFVTCNGCN